VPLHPGPGGALLDVSRLVGHQHRARVAEVPDDVTAHVVAHLAGVPFRALQQVLHPVRRPVPGMLGDRPAVLARQLRQQAEDECAGPPPRLHPAEPAADPGHQLIQHAQPAAGAYAGASGHQTLFTCRHKPG